MKTSTFIKRLQKAIDTHGDLCIQIETEHDFNRMKILKVGPYSKHSSKSHANKTFIKVDIDPC